MAMVPPMPAPQVPRAKPVSAQTTKEFERIKDTFALNGVPSWGLTGPEGIELKFTVKGDENQAKCFGFAHSP